MGSPTLNFVPCNSDFHTSPKAPSTIAYVVNSENGMGSGGSKYKTTSTKCWSSFLLSILSELRYLRTHLWRYLRVLRFQLTLSQSTAKMCAHASICAWTCENQSKNIYACLDLRKSLHKCLLKKYACFNLRFNLRKYFRKPLRTVGFALWFAQIHAHALICALICANLNGNSAGNRARILPLKND